MSLLGRIEKLEKRVPSIPLDIDFVGLVTNHSNLKDWVLIELNHHAIGDGLIVQLNRQTGKLKGSFSDDYPVNGNLIYA